MEHYICELKSRLHEVMEHPVTLGRAEEAMVYADAICALRRVGERGDGEPFTEEDAKHWAAKMENADGTTGEHWTMEQTSQVATVAGAHYAPWVWYAALNMAYSDYFAVATKYGLDRPEFYADLAKAFLDDKDAGGAEKKIAEYYHEIVKD